MATPFALPCETCLHCDGIPTASTRHGCLPTSAAAIALMVVLRVKSLAARVGQEGREQLSDLDNKLVRPSRVVGHLSPQNRARDVLHQPHC